MRASIGRNGKRAVNATPHHQVVAEQADSQRSIADVSALSNRVPGGA